MEEAERIYERQGNALKLTMIRFQRAFNHANLGFAFLAQTLTMALHEDLKDALVRIQMKQAQAPVDIRAGMDEGFRELEAVGAIIPHLPLSHAPKDGTDWTTLFTVIADFPDTAGTEDHERLVAWCDRILSLIPKQFVVAQLAVPLLKASVLLREERFQGLSSTLLRMVAYVRSMNGFGVSKATESMSHGLASLALGLEGIFSEGLEPLLRATEELGEAIRCGGECGLETAGFCLDLSGFHAGIARLLMNENRDEEATAHLELAAAAAERADRADLALSLRIEAANGQLPLAEIPVEDIAQLVMFAKRLIGHPRDGRHRKDFIKTAERLTNASRETVIHSLSRGDGKIYRRLEIWLGESLLTQLQNCFFDKAS